MTKAERGKTNLRVFFSYAIADMAHAQKVRSTLSKLPNIQIFTTDTLSAGEDWIPKLRKALSECNIFVVLLSPNALESKWVLYELGAAWGLNKTIIPVVTQPEMFNKVPLVLRDIRSVDIKNFENIEDVNQILGEYEQVA